MRLVDLEPGQTGKIVFVEKGKAASRRLLELGIVPGARVRIIARHPFRGPLVLEVGRAQVALGRKAAEAVRVELDGE